MKIEVENYEIACDKQGRLALLFDLRDLPDAFRPEALEYVRLSKEKIHTGITVSGNPQVIGVDFIGLPPELHQMLSGQNEMLVTGLLPGAVIFCEAGKIESV